MCNTYIYTYIKMIIKINNSYWFFSEEPMSLCKIVRDRIRILSHKIGDS